MKSKWAYTVLMGLITMTVNSATPQAQPNNQADIKPNPVGTQIDPTKIFVILGNEFNNTIRYYPQITGITMIVEVQALSNGLLELLLNSKTIAKDWDIVAKDKRYSHAIYKLSEAAEGDTKVFTRPGTTDSISLPNSAFIRSELRKLNPDDENATVQYILVSLIKQKIANLPERIIFYCMDADENNQFNQLNELLRNIERSESKLKSA